MKHFKFKFAIVGEIIMKNQVFNPYLPSYEYIPDGEPHVFNNRLYIYGSHDRFGGTDFCLNDYVCWSAPVEDLSDWKYEGVIYRKDQHPFKGESANLFAPDVARGLDGRFYLYYSPSASCIISVAVSDTPAGHYEYYGDVKDQKGRILGSDKEDWFQFDPAVLVDNDSRIWLYSGSGQNDNKQYGHPVVGAFVMELDSDMLTVKAGPTIIMPADETREKPNFFEASSIRKIGELYYFVYFATDISGLNYCTSKYPDRDFVYRGRIHNSSDIGLNGGGLWDAVYPIGNNHGGIECVNGQYYIFNHRMTNQTLYSRQGVAEPITIFEDGTIMQVESTSCGLNGEPLIGYGEYPAYIACNLIPSWMGPYMTQDAEDLEYAECKESPIQYIAGIKDGCMIGFKYFAFNEENKPQKIAIKIRGDAKGELQIAHSREADPLGAVTFELNDVAWTNFYADILIEPGVHPLFFRFIGNGQFDMISFAIS